MLNVELLPEVTGLEESRKLVWFGRPEMLKFTGVVEDPIPVLTKTLPVVPRFTVNESGDGMVKSAYTYTVTVVDRARVPEVPVTVTV
jgi:hypothetical protein